MSHKHAVSCAVCKKQTQQCQRVNAACACGAGLIALQINLIFAIWIKYTPAGLGTAPLTTPVASTAILVLGLAYLLAANARWAPFLGSVDAKLAASVGKVCAGLGRALPAVRVSDSSDCC